MKIASYGKRALWRFSFSLLFILCLAGTRSRCYAKPYASRDHNRVNGISTGIVSKFLPVDSGLKDEQDTVQYSCISALNAAIEMHGGNWQLNNFQDQAWYYFLAEEQASLVIQLSKPISRFDLSSEGFELIGPFRDFRSACSVISGEMQKPESLSPSLCDSSSLCFSSFADQGVYLIFIGNNNPGIISINYGISRKENTSADGFGHENLTHKHTKTDLIGATGKSALEGRKAKRDEPRDSVFNASQGGISSKLENLKFDQKQSEKSATNGKRHFEVTIHSKDEDLVARYEKALDNFPRLEQYRKRNVRVRIPLGEDDGYVELWSATELLNIYGRAIRPLNLSDDAPLLVSRFFLTPGNLIKERLLK